MMSSNQPFQRKRISANNSNSAKTNEDYNKKMPDPEDPNEVKQNPSAGAETDSNSTDVENNSINGTEGNYEEKGDKAF